MNPKTTTVDQAVAAARAAQPVWARTAATERGRLLEEARGGVLAAVGTLTQYANSGRCTGDAAFSARGQPWT